MVTDRAQCGGAPFNWLTSLGRQENWITMEGLEETLPFRGLLVLPAAEAANSWAAKVPLTSILRLLLS